MVGWRARKADSARGPAQFITTCGRRDATRGAPWRSRLTRLYPIRCGSRWPLTAARPGRSVRPRTLSRLSAVGWMHLMTPLCQQLMAKATSLCSLAVGLRGEPTCSTIGWLTRVTSPYARGRGSPLPCCRSQVTTRPAPYGAPERRRTSCQTDTEPFPPTRSGALCAGVRLCTATVPWRPSLRQTARRWRGPCPWASAFLCRLQPTVSCGDFYEPAPRASNGPALLWRASSCPNSTSGAVTVRYSVPVPSNKKASAARYASASGSVAASFRRVAR
jgi:hypothetical protein